MFLGEWSVFCAAGTMAEGLLRRIYFLYVAGTMNECLL